jgi:oxalate decarboxylase/phosphoglucose isomerase-like protein (cupin superfamily)
MSEPRLLSFPKFTNKGGSLSFLEQSATCPIDVKRVFWIYDTETEVARGNHAHLNSERILVCIQGKIEVSLENKEGLVTSYVLTNPDEGLYIPKLHWIKMLFAPKSMMVAMVNCLLDEDQVIHDFEEFKNVNLSPSIS